MLQTGCTYYPEHWPRERWAEDARLMREVGLSVVRMGEFAWDRLEPEAGKFDFGWLEDAIKALAEAGLVIVLATPTAAPPSWLTHKYPEICRTDANGNCIPPGSQRHACANVPAYQENTHRITQKLAERFGRHPAVVGWQIDNEFGSAHSAICYCDHCKKAFQKWLQEKYETLEFLNDAWGTQFWGNAYHDWVHIPVPGLNAEWQSPSLNLDYRRFASDSWVNFQKMQIEVIRASAPDKWITHNFSGRQSALDYWKLAADLDFVSYDNYPHGASSPAEVGMNFDLMRGLKGKSFWVMEQQPGQVNWHPYNPPLPAGQLELWSHQAIAHGAEAVVYAPWRVSRSGQGQRAAGLLKWDGTKDQSALEARNVSKSFERLPKFERPQAEIGILFDYEDFWATELEPHTKDFSYWSLVYDLYRPFWEANIGVDFLHRGADLTDYEAVILPAGVIAKSGEVEKYQDWVISGGRLFITFRTAVRTPANTTITDTLPAGMLELVGAQVGRAMTSPPPSYTEWPEHRPGTSVRRAGDNTTFNYKIWAETLELRGAEVWATYADGLLKGQPAVTVNIIGKGSVTYIGCWFNNFQTVLNVPEVRPLRRARLNAEDGTRWRLTYNTSISSVEGKEYGEPYSVHYARLKDENEKKAAETSK